MDLHSFWWRAFKKAYKEAKEPFERVGYACGIVAGFIALAYIAHLITQERGDYLMYWLIAFPVIVLALWFLWNFVRAPHLIREEDLANQNRGKEQIILKKPISSKVAGLALIAIIVLAFMVMLAVKNHQITKLTNQLSSPKQSAAIQRLPDKIIPAPSNSAPIIAPPHIAAAPISESQSPMQFETNNPNFAYNFQAAVSNAEAEKKSEIETAKRILAANTQNSWEKCRPIFNYALKTLYDDLNKEAEAKTDRIVITSGFLQCLPDTVNLSQRDIEVAEIKLQNDTNLSFTITLTMSYGVPENTNIFGPNGLRISGNCASLELRPRYFLGQDELQELLLTQNYNNKPFIPLDQYRQSINNGVAFLIGAQIECTNHSQ